MSFSWIASHDDLWNKIIFHDLFSQSGLQNINCFSGHLLCFINKRECSFISSEKIKFCIRWLLLQRDEEHFWSIIKNQLFCLKVHSIVNTFHHSMFSENLQQCHQCWFLQIRPFISSDQPDYSWKLNWCHGDQLTYSPCLSRTTTTAKQNFKNRAVIESSEEFSLFLCEFHMKLVFLNDIHFLFFNGYFYFSEHWLSTAG